MSTVLKALLQQRHMQTVAAFNREYDQVATKIEPELIGCGPKKAQFYRWLSGDVSGLPYPHHCRVLRVMFPGWTIEELFDSFSGTPDDLPARVPKAVAAKAITAEPVHLADVEAVYTTRSEFVRALPPQDLFKSARRIDMAGLSLNLLCQQYSDPELLELIENGAVIRCLFLDPKGTSIRNREIEEEHPSGLLSNLTDTNIRTLERVRGRISTTAAGELQIRVYDQPIRFNITVVNDEVCVMQPYLPKARGVESPTFVARRNSASGIYTTFSQVFESLWAEGYERNPNR